MNVPCPSNDVFYCSLYSIVLMGPHCSSNVPLSSYSVNKGSISLFYCPILFVIVSCVSPFTLSPKNCSDDLMTILFQVFDCNLWFMVLSLCFDPSILLLSSLNCLLNQKWFGDNLWSSRICIFPISYCQVLLFTICYSVNLVLVLIHRFLIVLSTCDTSVRQGV